MHRYRGTQIIGGDNMTRQDKIKALINEFGMTRKEADIFLIDLGE